MERTFYYALLAVIVALSAIEGGKSEKYLIGNAGTSNILLYDLKAGTQSVFIKAAPYLNHPDSMVYHPRTGLLLVASGTNSSNSAILQFDQFTGEYKGRFDDGKAPLDRPYGMAWTPGAEYLVVASFRNNAILKYRFDGTFVGALPGSDLLNGPNALHYGWDENLYLTTEGSLNNRGNITFPFDSQILRLRNGEWEVFVEDAGIYARPNDVVGPNFLGLASAPNPDGLLWVSDFSNGILAFDLKSGERVGRIETSYTGIPSHNALGSLVFEPTADPLQYSILAPGFEPRQGDIGCLMRATFNGTKFISDAKVSFAIPPNPGLVKPITIKQHLPFYPRR